MINNKIDFHPFPLFMKKLICFMRRYTPVFRTFLVLLGMMMGRGSRMSMPESWQESLTRCRAGRSAPWFLGVGSCWGSSSQWLMFRMWAMSRMWATSLSKSSCSRSSDSWCSSATCGGECQCGRTSLVFSLCALCLRVNCLICSVLIFNSFRLDARSRATFLHLHLTCHNNDAH